MFYPTSTKVFYQLSFFPVEEDSGGLLSQRGTAVAEDAASGETERGDSDPLSNTGSKIKEKNFQSFKKIKKKHILHSGRRGAASLHEPPPFAQPQRTEESERLPLGSLGTAAGWLMKRKQRVKRFPELPGRCFSGAGDGKED